MKSIVIADELNETDLSLIHRFVAAFLALSMLFVVVTSTASPAVALASPPVANIATIQKGAVYPTISCTTTGITFGGVTRGFVSYTAITYHWTIKRNGVPLFTNGSHGGYFTDRLGNHDRLPTGFPQAYDCEKGLYTIEMYVDGINSGTYYYTSTGTGSVACN